MTLKLNGSSSGSVSIDAPASTTSGADITFKLPVADGTSGQVLSTDGSGNLSWVTRAEWVYGTPTSVGTSNTYTVTGIPSNARRIVVTIDGISPNGSSGLKAKVGNSSGILSSGYNANGGYFYQSGQASTHLTSAFAFDNGDFVNTANVWFGVWELYNVKDHIWTMHSRMNAGLNSNSFLFGDGRIDTSSALDRLQLYTADSSINFDGGFVTVDYLTS
tara:strand:+ start:118 stop:771 length:654 start_codon:yes stop_codon:yes gene_type:complete